MPKPTPHPDVLSSPYWAAARQGELRVQRCVVCRRYVFPPVSHCPRCLASDLSWEIVSGRGVVYSTSVVWAQLVDGFEPPYALVEVALEEQPDVHITTNLVDGDWSAIKIGSPVEVAFEDRGGTVLPQFRASASDVNR